MPTLSSTLTFHIFIDFWNKIASTHTLKTCHYWKRCYCYPRSLAKTSHTEELNEQPYLVLPLPILKSLVKPTSPTQDHETQQSCKFQSRRLSPTLSCQQLLLSSAKQKPLQWSHMGKADISSSPSQAMQDLETNKTHPAYFEKQQKQRIKPWNSAIHDHAYAYLFKSKHYKALRFWEQIRLFKNKNKIPAYKEIHRLC